MCDEVAIQVQGTHGVSGSRSERSTGPTFEETYFDHVGKDYRWDS